jgi:hypothetical protein
VDTTFPLRPLGNRLHEVSLLKPTDFGQVVCSQRGSTVFGNGMPLYTTEYVDVPSVIAGEGRVYATQRLTLSPGLGLAG